MKRSTPTASNLRETVVLALFAALMVALQVAMAALPNIEPVTLLVILVAVRLGWKTLLSTAVFAILEGLLYGFGIWWLNYAYVWPVLVVIVMALRRYSHPLLWTMVAGIYGLLFGTLCSLPYFLTGGWAAGVSYIISGIPFDLLHCAGNVVMVGLLYKPLDRVLERCLRR